MSLSWLFSLCEVPELHFAGRAEGERSRRAVLSFHPYSELFWHWVLGEHRWLEHVIGCNRMQALTGLEFLAGGYGTGALTSALHRLMLWSSTRAKCSLSSPLSLPSLPATDLPSCRRGQTHLISFPLLPHQVRA